MSRNNDPNLRPFLVELERMVDRLKHDLPACPNCLHWNDKDEVCTLNGNRMRPPAPVIAFGCWAFENQDVPF